MQFTLTEFFGFLGILSSIAAGMWVIINRFTKLEGRVGRLEERMDSLERKFEKLAEKLDEILVYLAPKRKHKKMKRLRRD